MCERMQQSDVGIAARIRNMHPAITSFPNIEVVVDNQVLLNQMSAIKGRIRNTLVKRLHNDEITLNIRLAEAEEVTKVLSKKELFEELTSTNPVIERLRELMDLEIS